MPERLPDVIDPMGFAEKRRHLKGVIPVLKLDRLAEFLMETDGEVKVDLTFTRQGRTATIVGQVTADLTLQCQCCLGPISWPVACVVNLGIVNSLDAAMQLSDEMEPLLVTPDAEMPLADIVQDELILAVPAIPQHPDCRMPLPADPAPERPNPFADLAQLKSKRSIQE